MFGMVSNELASILNPLHGKLSYDVKICNANSLQPNKLGECLNFYAFYVT